VHNDVQVFALQQEADPGSWDLAGARIHNIGLRHTRRRAVRTICEMSRSSAFDVVHAIWSGNCGLIAVVAAKILGVPSLVHIAGGEVVAIRDIGFGGRLSWRGRLREALVLRATSAITAASTPVIESLSVLGLAAQRVPLGVDLSAWPSREPVRRPSSGPARLIHIASLNRVKDQSTLFRALAILMARGLSFEMDVVGEDTLHGEVQALATQLGLADRVRFQGFLPQRRLRPFVEAAHLLIMSSRHETGPLAMLEAAVAGVPTVGTAVGHIAEWAPGGAVAVAVGNPQSLADAIGELLDDEDRRLRIAHEAFLKATREDADYTARRFQEIYARVTDFR
jgi:glycosyltransferase involved in cell wall biosynthesis